MIYSKYINRESEIISYRLTKEQYNKPLYAFAYEEDERALNLKCLPVKGMIKDDRKFYEFRKDGESLRKYGVTIYSRFYADTYEEAVNGFNFLVNERITRLRNTIEELEGMLL